MRRTPTLVFHPFILGIYPILVTYSRNADSVYFGETIGPMIVVLLITLLCWAIIRRIWGDSVRAALMTTSLLFVVFSFERNVHALQTRGWGATPAAREWAVIAVGVGLLTAWWLFLRSVPAIARPLNSMSNAASAALVVFMMPGLFGAIRPTTAINPVGGLTARADAAWTAALNRPVARDPDIYFIVLDAYGRSDVLRSMLGYDNSAFVDRMRSRGFFVADRSTSNYCQTALSISATLSGQYHDARGVSNSKSRLPLRDLIADNPWLALLRRRSYTMVGFASGFGLTDSFHADERLAPSADLPDFAALVLDMTPFWTVLGQGAGQASHRRHRARILHVFDQIASVADDPRPTFCLAHVVAPHPPFIFDAVGRDLSGANPSFRLTDGTLWSDIEGHGGPDDYAALYRAQATYISDRVAAAVDQILARSPKPPVIIIQGDHGPGSHFDTDSPQPNDLLERMSILNLCLIPGIDPDRLRPTMTPVNTFRIIADHYFGTNLSLLPDRNYYSSYQTPYRTIDVTAEVSQGPR